MTYFISGHRNLSYDDFEKYYIPIIDRVARLDRFCNFVVGDCEGVDKFAMDYIFSTHMDRCSLSVYILGSVPRNTPLDRSIDTFDIIDVCFEGGFVSDEEKDKAMTLNSDFDIAFVKDNRWDSGTAQNIKRRHGI